MKTVFAAPQLHHAPTRFLSNGNIVDYPEAPERARRLLQGAREAGSQIFGARNFDPEILLKTHGRPYLQFLETAWAEWSALPGHGPELVASIRPMLKSAARPVHILAKAGWFTMDMSAPIAAATWSSAKASAFTALTAADLVLKGDPVVYALCRPPGHHAYLNRAGGFCYLNNAALAAQHLRDRHDRIAILDIDVHHGNGTQAIFYARPDVLTVSIHADPTGYYPFYYGYAEETGGGEGEGFNLNLPLPVRSGDDAWLAAVDQATERIAKFAPAALVVALGLDAHELDPVQGGAVSSAGFERIAERIAALGLPTVIVQEGGYLTEHLADNLAMFLTGFEGGLSQIVDVAAQ